jgi:hypothetical protein
MERNSDSDLGLGDGDISQGKFSLPFLPCGRDDVCFITLSILGSYLEPSALDITQEHYLKTSPSTS